MAVRHDDHADANDDDDDDDDDDVDDDDDDGVDDNDDDHDGWRPLTHQPSSYYGPGGLRP